ncbi:MAG: TetR/AcrR family transcriptional regulator [Lacisediminihabitans sp.]
MSSSDDLRVIALAEFATAGYAGTSLHRIADLAGLSKSSVLYHYASKETLLEAAISPAIERMGQILETMARHPITAESRRAFIDEFVDFLLEHRLEVHMFINQGPSLVDVPVIDRANELVVRLAQFFASTVSSTEDKMRFGIALGGAAYMLCTQDAFDLPVPPVEETRAALVTIVTELLAPISVAADPRPTN